MSLWSLADKYSTETYIVFCMTEISYLIMIYWNECNYYNFHLFIHKIYSTIIQWYKIPSQIHLIAVKVVITLFKEFIYIRVYIYINRMVFQMKYFIAKHRDTRKNANRDSEKLYSQKWKFKVFFYSEIKNALHTSTMNICVWVIVINNVVGSNL